MVWTQEDLDKLERAIAGGSGLQSLTLAGETFTFRSLDEMLRLRATMQQAIKNQAHASRVAATSKGV
jgi:hypothetical protein